MIPKGIFLWSVVFIVINFSTKIFQSASTIILAAVLPPLIYSNFGILYALQSAMGIFSTTGLTEYSISKMQSHSSLQQKSYLFCTISGAFIVNAALSFFLIIIPAFSIIYEKNLLIGGITAIILGGVIAFGTLQSSLQRLSKLQKDSLYSGSGIILGSIIGILGAGYLVNEINIIFIFGLIGAVTVLLILIIKKRLYIGSIPNLKILFSIFHSIKPYFVINLLGWLTGYGMNFFIDAKLCSLEVAYFTFLFNAASAGQLLASSMNMSWSPHFFTLFHDNHEMAESQSRRFYSLQALGMSVLGVLCVILLPYVTNIIGGNLVHYGKFKVELALLFVGYIFCIPFWHIQNYYFAAGKGRKLMHLSCWGGILGFISWILCMDLFSSLGVYIGFVLQAIFKSFFGWIAARRIWKINPPIIMIIISAFIVLISAYIPL